MDFDELSSAQAAQFCEHVVAREPYLLRELASWMDQTGGPLDQMDASVDSLVPLLEWYLDLARADFLGLTEGLVPSLFPEISGPDLTAELERSRQSLVGGDRLVHYVRLVLARLVPESYWGVYRSPGVIDNLHHQPAVFLPGWPSGPGRRGEWSVIFAANLGALAGAHVRKGTVEPDRLRSALIARCPRGLVPARQERLASVLRPYLDLALPSMPMIARVTPAQAWLHEPPPPPPPARARARGADDEGDEDWESLILARGPGAGLEDEPWLLDPLSADRIAAALAEGGFKGLDAATLLGGAEFEHPDGVAHVMVATHDGAVRAVHIQPVDPTARSWERLIAPLRMLAVELGANLVPEGEYPD
ncbi:hypothetical protein [Cellulomonas chengniuliangii]|uniref:hypothetical protein n=1 Tax=Cellulomonas chengniuliangii TaxID=2968084 RepID=UPI001D0EE778|nr:hypothetical protein [Cellulomonas chengniuliangii]MCC2318147.1 hypothetical protein [Cellulomonas chengniuliangii]